MQVSLLPRYYKTSSGMISRSLLAVVKMPLECVKCTTLLSKTPCKVKLTKHERFFTVTLITSSNFAEKEDSNRVRREKAMEKKNSRNNEVQSPSTTFNSKLKEFVYDLLFGCCKRSLIG